MSSNVKLVLSILQDEIDGNTKAALGKMHPGYTMTWMFKAKSGEFFPSSRPDFTAEVAEVYAITGREYDIKHIAEVGNIVFVELIESYPDPASGDVFRTPLVLVLEIEDGKIKTGRHYCDPAVSHAHLSAEQLQKAFK